MTTEQKAVLVTGCSSGLGRFTADFLMGKGWRVIVTARKECDALMLHNDGFESLLLDLNSSASIKEAAESVADITGGALYGLVNNAGIEFLGAIEDLSREDLKLCFETNVFGSIELTNRLIPIFRRQHFGRIIFISASNSNGFGYPFLGPGNATKSALEILATTLKRELRSTGICVSTVCPDELSTHLLVNMLRYSHHVLSEEKSAHTQTYSLLRNKFSHPAIECAPNKLLSVAGAIARILASKNPPRRVVAPFSAKLHYFAHAVLPEWLQDFLLFHKMKKGVGIDL
jgi:NAD(P)-dependent dehydrogenase (short-subunit alcohol dehydrogenase family)